MGTQDADFVPTPIPPYQQKVYDQLAAISLKQRLDIESLETNNKNSTRNTKEYFLFCALDQTRLTKIKNKICKTMTSEISLTGYRCPTCHSKYYGYGDKLRNEDNQNVLALVTYWDELK